MPSLSPHDTRAYTGTREVSVPRVRAQRDPLLRTHAPAGKPWGWHRLSAQVCTALPRRRQISSAWARPSPRTGSRKAPSSPRSTRGPRRGRGGAGGSAPARAGIFHEANGRAERAAAARSARTRARLWREEAVANGRAARGRAGQWETGEGLSRPMGGGRRTAHLRGVGYSLASAQSLVPIQR